MTFGVSRAEDSHEEELGKKKIWRSKGHSALWFETRRSPKKKGAGA